MTLYRYEKAPINLIPQPAMERVSKKSITVSQIFASSKKKIKNYLSTIRPITIVFPIIFIVSGIAILYAQIKPFAVHFIEAKLSDKYNQEITTLVPESYDLIRAQYISDPGSDYFATLLASQQPTEDDLSVKGKFYLTIDKIKIHSAPVTINVDSYSKDAYVKALGSGLAHFKGSSIPGRNANGNVFIYGHSAAGDYADKNPKDVVTAFTRLSRLALGDEITIEFEDQEFKYLVRKIKEVAPEDVSILNPSGSGRKVTLMTCSPPGLNSSRLIVVANEV